MNPKSEKATPEQLQEDKKRMEDEISFWRNLCESPSNYQRQLLVIMAQLFYVVHNMDSTMYSFVAEVENMRSAYRYPDHIST